MIRRLLPLFALVLARTVRFEWVQSSAGQHVSLPERSVVMFWHGKMFGGWYAMRKRKPVALVSRSKDGEYLAMVLASWGYQLVRGSSKKKGMEALQNAIDRIRTGASNTLVITPDGPKGPYHEFKRGAFIAARELGLPIYMLRVEYHSPITFAKSWDRFELPRPFSRVTMSLRPVDIAEFPNTIDDQRAWLDMLAHSFRD